MTSPLPEPGPGPSCVGVLLWRSAPAGREVAVLDVGGHAVLPKGVLGLDEDEHAAAERVADTFAGAYADDAAYLGTTRPPTEDGPATVLWWRLHWTGARSIPRLQGARLRWLSLDEAQVVLAQRDERELVRAERPGLRRRVARRWTRARRVRERRERWALEDRTQELLARPDGPGGAGVESWQVRALDRLGRAREALADGDRRAQREALSEVRRLELYGADAAELRTAAAGLRGAAECELPAAERAALKELLDREPLGAGDVVRAAAILDSGRASRADIDQTRDDVRAALGSVLVVVLAGVWLFGDPGWYDATPATRPAGMPVAVLLFGLAGGAVSALLPARRRIDALTRAWIAPVAGAVSALVVFAALSSGIVQLGPVSPPGWLALAFAAGFLERLVRR